MAQEEILEAVLRGEPLGGTVRVFYYQHEVDALQSEIRRGEQEKERLEAMIAELEGQLKWLRRPFWRRLLPMKSASPIRRKP